MANKPILILGVVLLGVILLSKKAKAAPGEAPEEVLQPGMKWWRNPYTGQLEQIPVDLYPELPPPDIWVEKPDIYVENSNWGAGEPQEGYGLMGIARRMGTARLI